MVRAVFEEISTLTSKGQTTVPKSIRQALGVTEGDKIAFRVDGKNVSVRRAQPGTDPAIASFLGFLARSIENEPAKMKTFSPDLARRIADLVRDVDVDPDAAIDGPVAL